MSLINQMLRDLDRQRGPASGAEVAALHGLGLVDGEPRRHRALPVFGIVTAITLAVVLGYWTAGHLAGETSPLPVTATDDSLSPGQVSAAGPGSKTLIGPKVRHGPESIEASARRPDLRRKEGQAETASTENAVATAGETQPAPGDTETPAHAASGSKATARKPDASRRQGAIASIETRPPVKSAPTTNAVVAPDTGSNFSLSPAQKADRLYNQAQQALAGDRIEAARILLEKILAEAPHHADAREQLATLMIRANRPERAETLLAEGLALGPLRLELLHAYAQLLVERGAFQQALNALQGASDSHTANAETLALKAGILARLQHHAEAADAYRQALRRQPGQAVWWTGLGVALEQDGYSMPALDAYRHAVRFPLQEAVRQFVQQRIRALGGPGASPQG